MRRITELGFVARVAVFVAAMATGAMGTRPAIARPVAPLLVCQTTPEVAVCDSGPPDCALCHDGDPPPLNLFGGSVQSELRALSPEVSEAAFQRWFGAAFRAALLVDPDGDGFTSADELVLGTDPALATSKPDVENCGDGRCGYDAVLAHRRVHLDFCGASPSFEAHEAFKNLPAEEQREELHQVLDECLDTEFWRGIDGRVWQLANSKVRPINDMLETAWDYGLFVYGNTDGHDVREILTAQYEVGTFQEGGQSIYAVLSEEGSNIAYRMPKEHRAGMLTTLWNLQQTIMFSPLPRTAAAAAYREFLGLDIARLQGLRPVASEPQDYDAKGVTAPDCAFCHSTLDPLSYPFTRYHGLTGDPGSFDDDRVVSFFNGVTPRMHEMPHTGEILGQTVDTLQEWAQVAANSEFFAQNVVNDYWTLVFGREPQAGEREEYETLWLGLMTQYDYDVERMLHGLIDTEAYGGR